MIPVGDGTFYLPGYSNRQKMPTNSKLSVMIRRMFIRTLKRISSCIRWYNLAQFANLVGNCQFPVYKAAESRSN